MTYDLNNAIPVYPAHTSTSLLQFEIRTKEKNELIYEVNLNGKDKATIEVNIVVRIEQNMLDSLKPDDTALVYLNASLTGYGNIIAYQYIQLPLKELKDTNNTYTRLQYEFDVPKIVTDQYSKVNHTVNSFDLSLAFSTKRPNEMGISESTRVGTFLSTRVAVEQ